MNQKKQDTLPHQVGDVWESKEKILKIPSDIATLKFKTFELLKGPKL
jgi:hypothetical protein